MINNGEGLQNGRGGGKLNFIPTKRRCVVNALAMLKGGGGTKWVEVVVAQDT